MSDAGIPCQVCNTPLIFVRQDTDTDLVWTWRCENDHWWQQRPQGWIAVDRSAIAVERLAVVLEEDVPVVVPVVVPSARLGVGRLGLMRMGVEP